jgi:hypothetical protein
MQNTLRKIFVMIIFLITSTLSCATFANYTLMPLKQRHLRISLDGTYTEYNWNEEVCVKRILICVKYETKKHVEIDFNLDDPLDRKKLNDMGFELVVRERP